MRQFTLKETFLLSEILDKMDFKIDLNQLLDDKANQAYIGGQMILVLLKRMHLAEREMVKLMASVSEEPIAEVEKWSISRVKEFLTDLASQDGIKDFFG